MRVVYEVHCTSINNMAHNIEIEKGPHEAETSLSCAHCMVLVIIYKNDLLPTLQNISWTQKAVQSILISIVHIPIRLTLIIAVSGWSQLDIGCLGKRGFKSIGCAFQIGIIRQYCCSLSHTSYVFVSTSCAHYCFPYSNMIHC